MRIADIDAAGWVTLPAGPGVVAAHSVLIPIKRAGEVFAPDMKVVAGVQTHSDHIRVVTSADTLLDDTDALITFEAGIGVGIRTADCVPVVINAPDIGVVTAVHAGWRGTQAGIVGKCVSMLIERGADPTLICAAIGPCICRDCYEVSEELADRFEEAGYPEAIVRYEDRRPHIDLRAANRQQLLRDGLSEVHIHVADECTLCTSPAGALPSYRRDATARRLYTVIARKK